MVQESHPENEGSSHKPRKKSSNGRRISRNARRLNTRRAGKKKSVSKKRIRRSKRRRNERRNV